MPIDVKKYIDVDSKDTPIVIYRDKVPVMETLNVTPEIISQEIEPAEGIDGFSRVNVSAVNATIDSNILPQNIKEGVSILGVNGSLETTRYGASLNTFFGEVINGELERPSELVDLVFSGVVSIGNKALFYQFYDNDAIRSVSFPDLVSSDYLGGLQDSFYGCSNLTTLSCPKAKRLYAPYAFSGCPNLDNVYLPELEVMRYMSYSFSGSKVTNLVMPKVKSITGANGCFNNIKIEELDMSSVETISGLNAAMEFLSYCQHLVSADFSGLTEVNGQSACSNMFLNDEKLESLDMSNLETVIGTNAMTYLCYGCSRLKTMTFDKLSKVGKSVGGYTYYEFQWAFALSGIETLSFPALKSDSFVDYEVFMNMLYGVDGCTVHFPSNLQAVIGNWADVINGFGGTNTTVLFDLPATE